ncbi:endonuclease V [Streptomyces sp. SLBN-31]|nr:endonuclease V [Streptomyces sp. SLBN-31]
MFVSVGHRTNLDNACAHVLSLTPSYRLPETTRRADALCRRALREAVSPRKPVADLAAADPARSWGRSLFERQAAPVTWAGRVLDAAAVGPDRTPEIAAALELARDFEQWHRGRELFALVRGSGAADQAGLTEERRIVLRLAELVCKVAHNTAGPPPYFDHHAGWQIGPLARRLAVLTRDPALRDRIEDALGERPPAGA